MMNNINVESIKNVFGNAAENYIQISKLILEEISVNKSEYSYIDNSIFQSLSLENGIGQTNKVITFETFQRAYIATITGYLR
ncbi:hypothetical protein [Clostridium argentinense]|nr:hypothetical protein [Clostridium argentinense]NFF40256.1 hypothetical protein [Clostridium argentinense]NFP50065.1 hypothetical protein [Clostridium argentinense]NFP74610.1 hypothetical protein [Clostridium argentinense]NFP78657.1 hypothetical protein [Clostridium argentinense]